MKIPVVQHVKKHVYTIYLGVTITNDLSWTKHIQNMAAQANNTVGFLRRNIRDCTAKIRSATYITMVLPTLECASTVWDPYKQKDAQLLEKVQHQAARYACDNFRDRTLGTVNCCSTILSGTDADSTTDFRCCTGSIMGWLTSTSLASANMQIPGQKEPKTYTRSTPVTLLCLIPSSPTP